MKSSAVLGQHYIKLAFRLLCLPLLLISIVSCRDNPTVQDGGPALPTAASTISALSTPISTPGQSETAYPVESAPPAVETASAPYPASGGSESAPSAGAGSSGTSPDDVATSVVQFPLTMNDAPASTPTPSATEQKPTTVPTAEGTPSIDYPVYEGSPLSRDSIGVQVHIHREDQAAIFEHLELLDVGWVKLQVSWKLYEPEPGKWDDFRLDELDRFVSTANDKGMKVLLGVAKAPEWSRPTPELDGPPSDFSHFQSFMGRLAGRYEGRVAAYELWNEANLQREWNGFPLSAADFVSLVQAGAAGARATDSQAIIISGAPAPTGINDGSTAIDDRQYLRSMVAAGIGAVVDAVGVHPYGWANPAESSWLDPEQTAPTHNNHPSFFFADTLGDYRAILDQNGLSEIPLWSTEFGWGSYDGMEVSPPPGAEYMAYVDEWQQAAYTLKAYQLADEWNVDGPLIIWNLNFAPTFGSQFVESAYSLFRPDGDKRPIFNSVAAIPRTD